MENDGLWCVAVQKEVCKKYAEVADDEIRG